MGQLLMEVRAAIRRASDSHGKPTPRLRRLAETRLPTKHGQFRAVGYRARFDDWDQVALVAGSVADTERVLVRLHSECLTGESFKSLRCDCGPQLDAALRMVARNGEGVVVYLRGHEGRGTSLLGKLRAYELQDNGYDTVDANLAIGLPVDARSYRVAADILADLGVLSVRLLSNNPAKHQELTQYGVSIAERVPLFTGPNAENISYLRTKRDRMGHDLSEVSNWKEMS